MVRTQVQLEEEQAKALRRLAADRGVSVAQLIREGVETVLRSSHSRSTAERRRRLLSAVGRFRSGLRDVSSRHDHYLAEAYRK